MNRVPFRIAFFVAALAALGIYAAAVTIPNVFSPGDPIVAEEVNENFQELAAAVEQASTPVEAAFTPGVDRLAGPFTVDAAFSALAESVTTTVRGRWLVQKFASAEVSCSETSARLYFLTIDGTPVKSTAIFVSSSDSAINGVLSGVTESVYDPGTYELGVGADCYIGGSSGSGVTAISNGSVVVFPE